jgi:hypothetical protein
LSREIATYKAIVGGIFHDCVERGHVLVPLATALGSDVPEGLSAFKLGVNCFPSIRVRAVFETASELVQHPIEIFNCCFAV